MVQKGKGFQFAAHLVMIILTICSVAPFLLMVAASLTEEKTLSVYGYSFLPKKIDFSAYIYLFASSNVMLRAYGVSILVTVVGTIMNLMQFLLILFQEKTYPDAISLLFICFLPCCLMEDLFHLILCGHRPSIFRIRWRRFWYPACCWALIILL